MPRIEFEANGFKFRGSVGELKRLIETINEIGNKKLADLTEMEKLRICFGVLLREDG